MTAKLNIYGFKYINNKNENGHYVL